MKTKEEIIEALDVLQREATPGDDRAKIVIAMKALGAAIESDWPSPGRFELLPGWPNGTSNYRIKRAPKIRPLTEGEWKRVRGLVADKTELLVPVYNVTVAREFADRLATAYPAGNPDDVRKLYAEIAS